jgi:hypothetical protein
VNEHEYEPIRGLPAHLPEGEAILWQGAPSWRVFAVRALHLRAIAIYFAVLAAWRVASDLNDGTLSAATAMSLLGLAGTLCVALATLGLFAWLVRRTTVYTITSKRVVLRIGIALPITIQIPFKLIDSAGLRPWRGGAGDIALTLARGERIAYLALWPHARPWRLTRPQPTLRSLPDGEAVAQVLARALAAAAEQPAQATQTAEPTIRIRPGADAPVAAAA